MPEERLPQEVEEWLQSIDAHTTAAERIGAFYMKMRSIIANADHARDMTQTWMMVVYGFPKNLPQPPRQED